MTQSECLETSLMKMEILLKAKQGLLKKDIFKKKYKQWKNLWSDCKVRGYTFTSFLYFSYGI